MEGRPYSYLYNKSTKNTPGIHPTSRLVPDHNIYIIYTNEETE